MSGTLIFGGGQLGLSLKYFFHDAAVIYHSGENREIVDIANYASLERVFKIYKPDIVINAAAFTDVDRCESEKPMAFNTNALGVFNIARLCRIHSSKLVHFSTDYVFNGSTGLYKEDSVPDPVNYYGFSKSIGDAFALSLDHSLVIRTSGVYGSSRNFPIFVYNSLLNGKNVNALKGYYSPISSHLLAKATAEIMKNENVDGILNIAGDRISRYEFALKIAETFSLDRSLIREVDSIPAMKARRPFDSSLDISKTKKMISFDFSSTDENLKIFSDLMKGGKIS